jgi:DNA gyrase subunit A
VVAACSLDPRSIGEIKAAKEGAEPATHALAVSSDGFALRFGLEPFVEPSTRAGRRYARPRPRKEKPSEIVGVEVVHGRETVIAATREARAILCPAKEVNFLAGAGKGVTLIKLGGEDRVLGFRVAMDDRDTLTAKTSMGGEQRINTGRYEVTGRGGKGREIIKRGQFVAVVAEEATAPVLLEEPPEGRQG